MRNGAVGSMGLAVFADESVLLTTSPFLEIKCPRPAIMTSHWYTRLLPEQGHLVGNAMQNVKFSV